MKKKILKYNHLAIACIVLISLLSCNDLDLTPTDRFTENNYWISTEKAHLVLNMAYSQVMPNDDDGNNNIFFFSTEALSDNVFEGRGSSAEKAISSGQADASNGRFQTEWEKRYAGIKTCNTFLENVDRVPNMDVELKARMKAEARFLRAYQFFMLTTWYGAVPLFDYNISLSEAETISRTSQNEVLGFVRNELSDVAEILPAKEDYEDEDLGRATSGAAIALLARTYLFSNDWQNVVTTCEKLINTSDYGSYELYSSYSEVFLPANENNDEVIFDVQYVPVFRTWSNYFDLGPLSAGSRLNQMAPTQELVDSYIMLNGMAIDEAGSGYDEANPYVNRDPRLTATVVYHNYTWDDLNGNTHTIYIEPGTDPGDDDLDEYKGQGTNATSTGYYLRKYYDPEALTDYVSGLNLILIRYADVLLMYAEAKHELGQMNQGVWDQTIGAIRQRAGFTDAGALDYNAALSTEAMRQVIRNERRIELAMEGLRIFDIRRWRTAVVVLNGNPHGARYGEPGIDDGYIRLEVRSFNPERDYLWAVPQSEKDINANLGQNPNY